MSLFVQLSTLLKTILLSPFTIFVFCIIFLASLGKSLGVRRFYVNLLLRIFEYGRINIEKSKVVNLNNVYETPTDDEDEEVHQTEVNQIEVEKIKSINNKKLQNGLSNGFGSNSMEHNGNSLISRNAILMSPDGTKKNKEEKYKSNEESKEEEKTVDFNLSNCLEYIKAGMEAIIEDEVTSRFEAEELKNWNLLTRTNRRYEFISWRLTVMWVIGFFIRYCILMPLRVLICFIGVAWMVFSFSAIGLLPTRKLRQALNDWSFIIFHRLVTRSLSCVIKLHNPENKPQNCGFCVTNHTSPIDICILGSDCSYSLVLWLTICTAALGCLPETNNKRHYVQEVSMHCFKLLSSALSSDIHYHNLENKPVNGICVANHTSPIDVLVLMCNGSYSLIGQRHGGFLGVLQRALIRASPHIWFERAEAKDRHAVAKRLKEHVSNPNNPPILIFPEGTCINNTSVMQFKKGSFEVGGVIYPVAIKYDPRFGDAFWNSSRYSMMQHLFLMMTSWAIVCDVWYLPPMHRREDESAIDFANRVKSVIAKQGGLVDLQWDGQLKRIKPKKEWKERQQEEFTKRLKGE